MYICSQLAIVGIPFSIIMIKSYTDVLETEAGKTDIVCTISFCLKKDIKSVLIEIENV